ncbi:MAG TPA: MFS transporter [Mycobacteriales bacterium]|nr:MFS transporter [Mycobacteriales bacterium]
MARFRLRSFAVDTRPLQVPAFRRLWLGQIVTVIGNQMTQVAVPVQVYDLTHSSLYVGLTSMIALIPLIIFGLFGGAIADAMDRRVLLLITGSGLALTSLALWFQALMSAHGSLLVLWSLAAVQSALFAINSPARSAVIPRLLSKEVVPSANALNQVVFNGGVIVGPLIAGVLIDGGGVPWAYFIDACTFLVGLWTIFKLPSMLPEAARRAGVASVLEGLRFLRARQVLMMAFAVDIVAMVFGWPRALFPQLADTVYGGGALGWLYAGSAIGALIAALSSGWVSRVNRQGVAVLFAVAIWGVAIMLFGLSRSLPLAVACLALAGAGDMVSAVFRSSILQTAAPDEMRGRLQGVFVVVVAGGPRLGDLRSGGFAAAFSPTLSSVIGGILCIVGVIAIAVFAREFTRYDARTATGAHAVPQPEKPAQLDAG